MSRITLLTVFTFSLFVGFGQGILDCRDPPDETQTFFDVVEIQSLAAKYPDDIQTPVKCSSVNDSSTCTNQICCGDEVGCCYSDTENNRHICGCKADTDKECTRGPPVVYFRSYRCEDHHSSESSTCIRKNKEGEIVEGSVETSFKTLTRNDALSAVGQATGIVGDTPLGFTDLSTLAVNGAPFEGVVENLPVRDIVRMISTEKLYSIAKYVMEKHNKGIPYGRQQTKWNSV